MKKFTLLLLFSPLLWLLACNNDTTLADESEFKIYSSDSLGFEIEYPKTFETREYFNQFIPIAFFEKITDSTTDIYPENVLVNIEPIPVEVPFGDFIKASKTQLKIMMPELEIFGEDSINIDGVPTGVYQFKRPKENGPDFVAKMFVLKDKNRAINFSCTATEEMFETYQPIFDRIVNSLKLKKK